MTGSGITIAFVGGPADGRLLAIGDEQPPRMYRVAIPPPIASLFGDLSEPSPLRAAEYEPLLERGWPSRTDDGTYRYQYRGTPEPPHRGQRRPTPTLDELAVMTRDPSPTAYPDNPAHLLACRTRHSLERDQRLTCQEVEALDAVTWERIQQDRAQRRP